MKKRNLRKIYFIIIIIFSITFSSNYVKARDCDPPDSPETNYEKHYKSIMIEYGDTLWGIAAQYRDTDHESIRDYIDELMAINNLDTDQIHAGQYLAVPYYE